MDKRNPLYYPLVGICWVLSLIIMSFPYLGFNLMDHRLIFKAWKNLGYYYYYVLLAMFVLGFILPAFPKDYWDKKEQAKKEKQEKEEKEKKE